MIWDVAFPPRIDERKDVAVFSLTVKLPDDEVDVGYGMLWPEEGRELSYYVRLAEVVGFQILSQWEEGQRIFLELRKP